MQLGPMSMPGGGSSGLAKFRPQGSLAVRGKGRESMRGSQATHRWSWRGLRWPEVGCPWETGPAAGGERQRRRTSVRGKEGLGWGGAVGAGEAEDATSLGRERAEEEVPRRQGLVGANGGAAGCWARASRAGQPFVGNWERGGRRERVMCRF
jgi:hypothetical protein